MHFLDQAKIYLKSGAGGPGAVSFRREMYVEYGGPDGGNGGKGGDIVFEAVAGLNTLIDFRYAQHFKAPRGGHGSGQNRNGLPCSGQKRTCSIGEMSQRCTVSSAFRKRFSCSISAGAHCLRVLPTGPKLSFSPSSVYGANQWLQPPLP